MGAQAIIGDIVSPRQRGRYMGYFGAVFGLSSVIGPLAGGFITQHLSWRWVFYINLPIGIAALAIIAAVLHLPRKRTRHAIDFLGTALLGGAVTVIILLTTWGGTTYAWGSAPIFSLAAAAVILVALFCWAETRAAEPIIPLGLFRISVFSVSNSVGFIVGFVMFGSIIYIPLYLQTVHAATPTSSGLQLLPLVGGMLITFTISGRLVTRWGRYKIFPILGTGVMSIGLFLFSLLTPSTPLAVSSVYMFVLGAGIGGVMQVLVVAVQNAVPRSQLGTATSSSAFFRSIGGSFGVAVFGAVFNNRLAANLPRYLPPAALRAVHGSNVSASPAQLDALPLAIHHGYVLAFSESLHAVFLIGAPIALVAFALTWFLKDLPLRDHAYVAGDTAAPGGTRVMSRGTPPSCRARHVAHPPAARIRSDYSWLSCGSSSPGAASDYAGRLSAHLPSALPGCSSSRPIARCSCIQTAARYKPLNWMSPPCRLAQEAGSLGRDGEVWRDADHRYRGDHQRQLVRPRG